MVLMFTYLVTALTNTEDINYIQGLLKNETVGYEIIDQGNSFCVIRNIGGMVEAFNSIMKRLITVLISMSEECERGLEEGNIALIKSTVALEKSNNKFTTLCRRYLNKKGDPEKREVGPLYFIIENMEKIADEYKYLALAVSENNGKKLRADKDVLEIVNKQSVALNAFYEGFYSKDNKKFVIISELRKQVIMKWHDMLPKFKNHIDILIMHHSVVIIQKIFELVGPAIIINTKANQKIN